MPTKKLNLRMREESVMNKVAVVFFDDEKQAYEGSRAIRELHKEGSITLYGEAVIAKNAGGEVAVRRVDGDEAVGTLSGMLLGSMIGLLGGPAGVAIGMGAGTLVGAGIDLTRASIGSDFLGGVSDRLAPGKAAVIAEVDEPWETPLDTRMETLGGQVLRRNTIHVEDTYFEREIAATEAELEALEEELEKASADRRAKLQAKVQETKKRLRSKREELQKHIDSVKKEGEAKAEALQRQIATAKGEKKARLEKRMSQVRSEYEQRTAKLREAWELTRSALKP